MCGDGPRIPHEMQNQISGLLNILALQVLFIESIGRNLTAGARLWR